MIPRASDTGCLKFRSLTVSSVALLGALLVSAPPPAQAQGTDWGFGNSSPYPRRAIKPLRRPVAKRSREADDGAERHAKGKGASVAEKEPTGPLFAILSLSDQHISIYNSSGLVTRTKVSTGMPGHRTPMGIYSIIGRERFHASNIYSGAPMPFMQRITWSGVAMHLGVVPGYPASHGCIRLPSGSAERLWGLTKIGERVVISPHEVAPASITHPMLPTPKLLPSPASVADAGPAKATEIAAAGNDPLPIGGPRLLNPLEYARALKARAAADVASATKAIQEANQRKDASPEARKALAELRAAETVRSQAEAKLSSRVEALATKRDTREFQRAEAAKAAAEAALAEAVRKVQAALDNPAFASPEARDAVEAERKLMEVRSLASKAQATARDAERRLSPVSVLISKKDNKVYVRQALAPILEAAVTIRDPQTPLGTHVYIATSSSGDSLGWTAISYPHSSKGAEQPGSRRRDARGEAAPIAERAPAPNASQALERVELPAEVLARISERLWTGGSLIITDESLSDETSDVGTDLVVTVR
jgi:hypothetical protein